MSENYHFLTLHERNLRAGGRFLVVGDIHGQYEMFTRLLAHAEHSDMDVVVALGDLIDRGAGTIDVVRRFQDESNFYSLLGNHEAMLLAAEEDSALIRAWHREGGGWADTVDGDTLTSIHQYAQGLPIAAEISLNNGRRVGLVHAELPVTTHWDDLRRIAARSVDWLDQSGNTLTSSLLWGRSLAKFAFSDQAALLEVPSADSVDLLILGHTVVPDRTPRRVKNRIWIDTGAFWGSSWAPRLPAGRLTAVDPIAEMYWQVGRTPAETWGPFALP